MKEYKYKINGNEYVVAVGNIEGNVASVTVNGEEYKVEMEKAAAPKAAPKAEAPAAPKAAAPKAAAPAGKVDMNKAVKAPLPGVVNEICVAVGDSVKKGDTVVILEAMKMANNLTAEKDGTVTAILVGAGESVMEDTPLVVIE